MKTKICNYLFSAILMMGIATIMTGCAKEDIASNDNGGGTNPTDMKVDELNVKVTADVPTAVLSSFDAKSMGGALVRRLSKTTSSLDADTKMVLIKGEDILNRPITEWFEVAKIYLRGGYIAVEKPHNAHLVNVMEQLSAKLAQATHAILTEDDGSGIIINYNPSNSQSANAVNAEAERFKARIANIQAKSGHRTAGDEQQPVAEMVIFSRKGYYHCAPHQYSTSYGMIQDENGSRKIDGSSAFTNEYSSYASGLKADGAAEWINTKEQSLASNGINHRANGTDAINDLMSASEEYTYQADLSARGWKNEDDFDMGGPRKKPGAYKQIYRIWGAHNMDTNKDYYLVQQHITASIGGKQEGDARFDPNKTMYQGPYEANKWFGDEMVSYNVIFGEDPKTDQGKEYGKDIFIMQYWYGAWFDSGDYSMNLTGKGEPKLEEAVPLTDNNDASATVTVGEYKEETTNIGGSMSAVFTTKDAGIRPGVNYSHGYTNGTLYTMGYTSNAKELKVQKNTEGSKVTWNYACGTNMVSGKEKKHPFAPDALTGDVDMMNQACWSVANPEGAYTLNIEDNHGMAFLLCSGSFDSKFILKDCSTDGTTSYTLATPNRSSQTWYMDVDFPELGQDGYKGVKDELTDALKTQFPNIYQPTIVLADQTPKSENTIQNLVDMSKKLLNDPNALQTLRGYALDRGVSQFTIKWYCTDGNHAEPYTMTITAK